MIATSATRADVVALSESRGVQPLGRIRGRRRRRWSRRAEAAVARRSRPVRRLPSRLDDRRHDRHRLRLRRLHAERPRAGVAHLGQLPGAGDRRCVRRPRARRQGRTAPGVRPRRAVRAARRRPSTSSPPATSSSCRSLPTAMPAPPTPPAREAAPMHPFDEATRWPATRLRPTSPDPRLGPSASAARSIEGSSRRGAGADEGTMPGPQARRRGRTHRCTSPQ